MLLLLPLPPPPRSPLFPYTTLFRSLALGDLDQLLDPHVAAQPRGDGDVRALVVGAAVGRSEEHTSELQSPYDLVCRLLLEKKNREQIVPNRKVQSIVRHYASADLVR